MFVTFLFSQRRPKFINEHWKEVANEVQYSVLTADMKKIEKNANTYLKTIPIDEYQPQ